MSVRFAFVMQFLFTFQKQPCHLVLGQTSEFECTTKMVTNFFFSITINKTPFQYTHFQTNCTPNKTNQN